MAANLMQDALIYLGTALVCVPISKKLGIGSVLGYLIGGIIVGPFVLGFIGNESHDVMHTAEFGVVMMLFVIGLELNPKHFWKMRKLVVGLGGLQILLTSLLLFPLLYFSMSATINASIALALSFALSSTAIVMQTLKEKNIDKTPEGESSFAVLLFQDIAVIPVLALLPLLGVASTVEEKEHQLPGFLSFFENYPSLLILLAVAFVFLLSKYIMPYILRIIAKVEMHELFTAAALFFVIGIAWLMEFVGISAALGAFLAGVLLATSEFRHELEADINPFKGLLLGIFFTAVGATINFDIIAAQPLKIFGAVLVLMFVKWLVLFRLGKSFGLVSEKKVLFAFLLAQVGEFAFVLLSSISKLRIIDGQDLDFYMAVVTISMIVSPLFLFLNEKLLQPKLETKKKDAAQKADAIDEQHKVILIGFSDFGSILGRFLRANHVTATVIDSDSDRVTLLRKMGFTVFYGDGTRLDLLESAGAQEAKTLISTIGDPEKNKAIAEMVTKHFPHLKLYIRAVDYFDAFELIDKDVKNVYHDTLMGSVYMGVDILSDLGFRKYTLHRKAQNFIAYDQSMIQKLSKKQQEDSFIGSVREEIEIQEQLLMEDTVFMENSGDNAWEVGTRRE